MARVSLGLNFIWKWWIEPRPGIYFQLCHWLDVWFGTSQVSSLQSPILQFSFVEGGTQRVWFLRLHPVFSVWGGVVESNAHRGQAGNRNKSREPRVRKTWPQVKREGWRLTKGDTGWGVMWAQKYHIFWIFLRSCRYTFSVNSYNFWKQLVKFIVALF